MKSLTLIAFVAGMALSTIGTASAAGFAMDSTFSEEAPEVTLVSGGCGPFGWRGPWGHCRDTPYSGPLPGGGWAGPAPVDYFGNGCPPGFWHGPWGHCRDTPFHGRRPDGTWQ